MSQEHEHLACTSTIPWAGNVKVMTCNNLASHAYSGIQLREFAKELSPHKAVEIKMQMHHAWFDYFLWKVMLISISVFSMAKAAGGLSHCIQQMFLEGRTNFCAG